MRVLVALGGHGLRLPGRAAGPADPATATRSAALLLAQIAQGNTLVVTHGRGPQEDRLGRQAHGFGDLAGQAPGQPPEIGETDLAEQLLQELSRLLGPERTVRRLSTNAEVDPADPAFGHPSHPVGPEFTQDQAQRLAASHQWSTAATGRGYRRVVASALPRGVVDLGDIEALLAQHVVVIATGGGGIPVTATPAAMPVRDMDAFVDPDLFSGMLAHAVGADCLLFATDVEGHLAAPSTDGSYLPGPTSPQALAQLRFAPGSIGNQARAASRFVLDGGQRAAIGTLAQLPGLLNGSAGTQVTQAATSQKQDPPP